MNQMYNLRESNHNENRKTASARGGSGALSARAQAHPCPCAPAREASGHPRRFARTALALLVTLVVGAGSVWGQTVLIHRGSTSNSVTTGALTGSAGNFNYTAPAGHYISKIECWGGGGGGQRDDGMGGGGGGYAAVEPTNIPVGVGVSVSVGAGGNAGTSQTSAGTQGGNTEVSYGSSRKVTAYGGKAGGTNTNGTYGQGGQGGTVVGWTLTASANGGNGGDDRGNYGGGGGGAAGRGNGSNYNGNNGKRGDSNNGAGGDAKTTPPGGAGGKGAARDLNIWGQGPNYDADSGSDYGGGGGGGINGIGWRKNPGNGAPGCVVITITPADVTVTFNANGGTVGTTSETVEYNSALSALPTPTRPGYSFVNWYYLDVNNVKHYIASASTEVNEDNYYITWSVITGAVTLIAEWEAREYTITFDANRPAGVTENVNWNTTCFDGYSTTLSADNTRVFVREYSDEEQVYSTDCVEHTDAVRLEGYVLTGWSATATGESTVGYETAIAAGSNAGDIVFPADEDEKGSVTFYAQWREAYYCFMHSDGGTLAPTCVTSCGLNTTTDGYSFEIPSEGALNSGLAGDCGSAASISLEGYSFDGWYTKTAAGDWDALVDFSSEYNATSSLQIYAKWSPNHHTLTFDANGNTADPASFGLNNEDTVKARVYYNAEYSTAERNGAAGWSSHFGVQRPGFDFVGWYGEQKADNLAPADSIKADSLFKHDNDNQVVYAGWKAQTSTVTYVPNYGGVTDGTVVGEANKLVTYNAGYGELSTAARPGYDFAGWYVDEDCTEPAIVAETIVRTVGDHNLYAKWTKHTFTIVFHANGTETSPANIFGEDTVHAQVVFLAPYDSAKRSGEDVWTTHSRTGYDFAGWYPTETDAAAKTNEVTGTTPYTATEDTELWAGWTPKSYTLTFDANGTTASPAYFDDRTTANGTKATTIDYDAEYQTAKYNNVTGWKEFGVFRPGYDFVNWYDTEEHADALGADGVIAPTDIFHNDNDNTVVHAGWTPRSYPLKLYAEGSTGYDYSTYPAKFANNSNDTTLSNVTYDVTYGEITNWPTFGATRTGFSVTGWKTAGGDDRTADSVFHDGDTASTFALYAQWAPNEYTVTFELNAPSGASTTSTATVPDPKPVTFANAYGTLTDPALTGYTFGGWFKEPACTYEVTASTTVTTPDDHEIYAKWTANTYDVTYELHDGTGTAPENPKATFDQPYADSVNWTPTRNGYDFMGWWLGYDNGAYSDPVAFGTTPCTTANGHALHAKWKEHTYTVVLHSNYGNDATKDAYVDYTHKYNELSNGSDNWSNHFNITRTGYTFDYWYIDNPETPLDGTLTYDTNVKALYAHWIPNTYYCYLDLRGGTLPQACSACGKITSEGNYYKFPVVYDSPMNDSLLDCGCNLREVTKLGYGSTWKWWSGSPLSNQDFTNTWLSASNETLFVEWTNRTITITLDPQGGTLHQDNATNNGTYSMPYWFVYVNASDNSGNEITVKNVYGQWYRADNGNDWIGLPISGHRRYYYTHRNSNYLKNPTRVGYDFDGWYTEPNGGGTKVTNATELLTDNPEQTLYANWNPQNNAIYIKPLPNFQAPTVMPSGDCKFDINGDYYFRATYDTKLNTNAGWNCLSEIKRKGYSQRWYNNSDYLHEITGETVWNVTNLPDIGTNGNSLWTHIYLKWVPDTFTVTFDANAPEGETVQDMSVASARIVYDKPYDSIYNVVNDDTVRYLQIPYPQCEGYVFRGWFHKDGDEWGAEERGSSLCTTDSNHTLYAKWEPEINFDVRVVDVTCKDGVNGRIEVNGITGGEGSPYMIIIQKQGSTITDTLKNVSGDTAFVGTPTHPVDSGKWNVYVYDNAHPVGTGDEVTGSILCHREKEVQVSEPDSLAFEVLQVHPQKCAEQGKIDLDITGGTKPYHLYWTKAGLNQKDSIWTSAEANTISNLQAQNVTLHVTDINGCQTRGDVTVTIEPAGNPFDTATIADVTKNFCSGNEFSFLPDLSVLADSLRSDTRYSWPMPVASHERVQGLAVGSMESSIHGTIINDSSLAVTCTYVVTPWLGMNCEGTPFTVTIEVGPSTGNSPTTVTLATIEGCAGSPQELTAEFSRDVTDVVCIIGSDTLAMTGSGTQYSKEITMPNVYSGDITYFVYAHDGFCEVSGYDTLKTRVAPWTVTAEPGSSTVTCLRDAVRPTADMIPEVHDGCGIPCDTMLFRKEYSLDNSNWSDTAFDCDGYVRYTYQYKSKDDSVQYWHHTYTVTGMTTGTLVVSGAPTTIDAKSNSQYCLFQIPDMSDIFRAAVDETTTCSAPSALTVEQIPEAGRYITQTTTDTVKVKDGCGRESKYTVEVRVPSRPRVTSVSADPIACHDGTTSATANVTNGTAPYTYLWDDDQSQETATATGLVARQYTVTVKDSNGCVAYGFVTLTNPAVMTAGSIDTTGAQLCQGSNTTVNILSTGEATGGHGAVTYQWYVSKDGGEWTAIAGATGNSYQPGTDTLTEGEYLFKRKVINECAPDDLFTKSFKLTVRNTITPVIAMDDPDAARCKNGGIFFKETSIDNDSTIHYDFQWLVGDNEDGAILGTAVYREVQMAWTSAGEKQVRLAVTEKATGCVSTATYMVTVNELPALTVTSDRPSLCPGQDSVLLTATGNMTSYKWNDANQTTTQTLRVGEAGIYTVTATDANGCSNTANDTVGALTLPAVALNDGNRILTICSGQQEATLTATPENDTYVYIWYRDETVIDNHQSSYVTSDTGLYHVKVVDGEGCYAISNTLKVNYHNELNIEVSDQTVCEGQEAVLVAYNGETYVWEMSKLDSANKSLAYFHSDVAGTYTVSVTGMNSFGCSGSAEATVTVLPSVRLTYDPDLMEQTLCAGFPVEAIPFQVENGFLNFSGNLPSHVVFENGVISGIPVQVGTFNFTVVGVSDQNPACPSVNAEGVITVLPTATVSLTPKTQEVCVGSDISEVTISCTNGLLPLSSMVAAQGLAYTRNSNTSATLSGSFATAGTYTIPLTVSSSLGCAPTVDTVTIIVHPNPAVKITGLPEVCPYVNTQSMTATVTTTTTPDYHYYWTGDTWIDPMTTTTDATTNTVNANVPHSCHSDVSINLLVTDAYGCMATDTIIMQVRDNTVPHVAPIHSAEAMARAIGNCTYVVPNLKDSVVVTDECFSGNYTVYQDITEGTAFGANEMSKTVKVWVEGSCNPSDTVFFTVSRPAVVEVSVMATETTICKGSSTQLTANATSGFEGAFTYAWVPNTGLSATNTAVVTASPQETTTYTVTARDGNGCSATATQTVNVYPLPVVTIQEIPALCPATGSIEVTAEVDANGGTATQFTYAWSCEALNWSANATGNNSNTQTISNIPNTCAETTYTVNLEVTEAVHACKSTATAVITVKDDERPVIVASKNMVYAVSVGECNYQMPDLADSLSFTVTDLCSQTYAESHIVQSVAAGSEVIGSTSVRVTVTDACGNTGETVVEVRVPSNDIEVAGAVVDHVSCPGGSDGTAQIVFATGGLSLYTFLLDGEPVDSQDTLRNLTAGTHHVTAVAASGCTGTWEFVVNEPEGITATITTVPATCANNDGQVVVAAQGGNPLENNGYIFNFSGVLDYGEGIYANSPANSTPCTLQNLKVGHYTVDVKDALGCSYVDSFDIKLNDNLVIESIPTPAPVCSGGNFVTIPVTSTPGTTYYTWPEPEQSVANGVSGAAASPDGDPQITVNGSGLVNNTGNVPVALTYHVTAHNGVCTFDTAVVMTVTATVRPQVVVTPKNDTVCPGELNGYQLTATISNVYYADTDTLLWNFNNEFVNQVVNENPSTTFEAYQTLSVSEVENNTLYPFVVAYSDGVCTSYGEGHIFVTIPDNFTMVLPPFTDTIISCAEEAVYPHTVPGKMPVAVYDGCGQPVEEYTSVSYTMEPLTIRCNGTITFHYTYRAGLFDTVYDYTYHVVAPQLSLRPDSVQVVVCESDAVFPGLPQSMASPCGLHVNPVFPDSTAEAPNPVHDVTNGSGTVTYTFLFPSCDGNDYAWHFVYSVVPDSFDPFDTVVATVTCKSALLNPADVPVPDTTICGKHIEFILHANYPQDLFTADCGERTYRYDYEVNGVTYQWFFIERVEPGDFEMPENAGTTVHCYGDIDVAAIELPEVLDACGNLLEPLSHTPVMSPDMSEWNKCNDVVTCTYLYEDCQGHQHEWVFSWTVNDDSAPEFTLLPENNIVPAAHSIVNGNCVYTYPSGDELSVMAASTCSWNNAASHTMTYFQDPDPNAMLDEYIEQADTVQYLPMTVGATSACGVQSTTTILVEVPAKLYVNEVLSAHSNVSCFGRSDGEIRVMATGGTPGYTYSISEPAASQIQSGYFTDLPVPADSTYGVADSAQMVYLVTNGTNYPVTYPNGIWIGHDVVTVTDGHGCTATDTIEITSPVALEWLNCPDTVVFCADPGKDYYTLRLGEDFFPPVPSTGVNARFVRTNFLNVYHVGKPKDHTYAAMNTCGEIVTCTFYIKVLPNAFVKDSADNVVQEVCPGSGIDPIVFTFSNADTIVKSGSLPDELVAYETTQPTAYTSETKVTISGTPQVTEPTVYDFTFTAYSQVSPDGGQPCNEVAYSGAVTVHDAEAPIYLRPADTTLYPGDLCQVDVSPLSTGEPTAVTDLCTSILTVTYYDEAPVVDCGSSYHFNRVWRVTDQSGNISNSDSVQVITVMDTVRPVVAPGYTTQWAAIPNAECNSNVPDVCDEIRSFASDNCGGPLTVTQSPAAGTEIADNIVVTVTVADPCGNSTSLTVDVTATGALALLIDTVDAGCHAVPDDGFLTFTIQGDATQYIYTFDTISEFLSAGTYTVENLTYGEHVMAVMAIMPFCRAERVIDIQPIPDTLTVTANSGEWEYDAQEHQNATFTVKFGDAVISSNAVSGSEVELPNHDKVSAIVTSSITNAGTVDNVLSNMTVKRNGTDVKCKYYSVENAGTLTVNPAEVVVTIVGHNLTTDYDGTQHEVRGYDVVGISDTFYTVNNFVYTGDSLITRTNAGTSYMELVPSQFVNQLITHNIDTVIFEITDGYLTVNPIHAEVAIVGTVDTADYDGQEHMVTGFQATPSTALYDVDHDFTFSGSDTAKRTDAGTTQMGLAADQFENTNPNFATVTFHVTDGHQTIMPIDVTVTVAGHNDTAMYDGTEHMVTGYDVSFSTDLYTEADFTFNGSDTAKRTDAGTTQMGLAADQFENINPNFATVTFNVTDGHEMIVPKNDVVVTITGHYDTTMYDGTEHMVTGYDVSFSTDLYTEADFTFSGSDTAKRTDAGTTQMGLAADQFENTNPNFETVTFNVTDGYQVIVPLDDVVVTITGHYDTAMYDGAEHMVTGYDVSSSTDLYTEADFAFSGSDTAVRRHVVEGTDADGRTDMGLTESQFGNTSANFTNVTFMVTDGYQVIVPKNDVVVTITGQRDSLLFDGEEHGVNGYDVAINTDLYTEADFEFSGTAVAVQTNVGTAYMGLAADQFENRNSDFTNVTFNVADGYQKIESLDVTVTITGHADTVVYDGQMHSTIDYDVTFSNSLYSESYFTFDGGDTAAAQGIHTGTYSMHLDPGQFTNTNSNFSNVTFVVNNGSLTVIPLDVTVTITGHNNTAAYDGQEHVVTGYDVVASDTLYHADYINFNGSDTAKRRDAGTRNMGLAVTQFTNTNDDFTVVFSVTDGYQTITPIDVTVTVVGKNNTADYDGVAHTITGYTATPSTSLYHVDADFTFSGDSTATRTDAGTTNMGLAEGQFENTNSNFATVTFVVTDGYQTISPINAVVTIAGSRDTVVYDGVAHTITGFAATANTTLYDVDTSFVFNGAVTDSTATRTLAGQTDMTLAAGQFANTNPNFATVEFTVEQGHMYVKPREVTVEITGHFNVSFFDGEEHRVSGFDVNIPDTLYHREYFTYEGDSTAARTEKGITNMGLAASQFTNHNENFDVTFHVTDGYQKIEPRNVVVTITGHTDTVDYNGQLQQVTGYDVSFSNTFYTTADFKFNGTVADSTASGTDAGTYSMNLNAGQFTNLNTLNFDTVTFVVVDGSLTVNRIPATVTITGRNSVVDYDGQAHTVTGYTAVADPDFYNVDTNFVFTGQQSDSTATRTDADTTYMTLAASMFQNTNPNFSEVSFVVAEQGYQAVLPIDVTVTVVGKNNTADYDGVAHTITGYTATPSTSLYHVDADFTFSGDSTATRTDAGTTNMGLAEGQFENTNSNFATVTFVVTDGYQTINPINAVVTIVGEKDTVAYDGQAHTVTGYTATANTTLYDVNANIQYSGTEANYTASRTEAGQEEMTLTAAMFANTNENFANVTFNVENGYQMVIPREVTVTVKGHVDTVFFDNGPHTVHGFDAVIGDQIYNSGYYTYDGGESDSTVTETVVGTFPMGLDAAQFTNHNDNFMVTFAVTDGYLTILSNDVEVTIRGRYDSVVYDGQPHTVTGYEVVHIDHPIYSAADFKFVGQQADSTATRTIAGTDSMGLAPSQFENMNDHYSNVTFIVERDGFVTVTPMPLTVTVTGHNDTAAYNGAAHTVTGFELSTTEPLYDLGNTHFNGTENDSTATRTDAGTTYMGLLASHFSNADNNFDVTYNVTNGYQYVTPKEVMVTVTGEHYGTDNAVVYDGVEHTVTGYTMVSSDPDYNPYASVTFSGTATASRTDTGITYMGLTADMFGNTNVNYQVTFDVTDGYITIKPAVVNVLVKGNTVYATYDGVEHTVSGYTMSTTSETFDLGCIEFNGAPGDTIRTEDQSGEYSYLADIPAYDASQAPDAMFRLHQGCQSDNYVVNITVVSGKLSILPADSVVVVINPHRDTVMYDGQPHTVSGYDWVASDPDFTVLDFVFNGDSSITQTNAGQYYVQYTGSDFQRAGSSTFQHVGFLVSDYCALWIKKLDTMVVTVSGRTDTVPYDGQAHTVTGYSLSSNVDNLFDATKVVSNGNGSASRTYAGTTSMGLVASQFSYEDNNFTNVNFVVDDGHVTVTPIALTVKSYMDTMFHKIYDGTPLVVSYDQLEYEGFVAGDELTQGEIVSESAAVGMYVCGAGQMWSYADNEEGVAYAMGFGEPSVTQNYKVQFNVRLRIDPVNDLECPEQLQVMLLEGTSDTTLTEAQLGAVQHELLPQSATVASNISELNPLSAGTHVVTWVIYDINGTAMDTCEQTVVVEYAPCEEVAYNGYTYPVVRIGSQCWMAENLRTQTDAAGNAVADYHAFKDEDGNLQKFGYLYTWYSAVGVNENDNNAVPATQTGADGETFVQGVCPDGWAVPSVADYDNLNQFVGDAILLKDAGEGYWYPGLGGVLPNSGFNSRAGGFYNSATGRYEDLLTGDHYWKSDSTPGSASASTGTINYFCDSAAGNQAAKTDRRSVRCIKKM